jgi:hypothetical protein
MEDIRLPRHVIDLSNTIGRAACLHDVQTWRSLMFASRVRDKALWS